METDIYSYDIGALGSWKGPVLPIVHTPPIVKTTKRRTRQSNHKLKMENYWASDLKTRLPKRQLKHINIIDESSFFDTRDGLLKGDSLFFRVFYNQTHKYKDLKLKAVFGSLALGAHKKLAPQFIAGGSSFTKSQDFINIDTGMCHRNDKGELIYSEVDMHAWLEDEEGRIWDIVDTDWIEFIEMKGNYLTVEATQEIAGYTLEQAAKVGLHYIKAPGDTQYLLGLAIEKYFRKPYEEYHRKYFDVDGWKTNCHTYNVPLWLNPSDMPNIETREYDYSLPILKRPT